MALANLCRTVVWAVALGLGALSAAHAQAIKIGVIAPLTGPGAPWGLVSQHGPKILAAEVNAKGGLEVAGKKHPVEIVAYDDQYKAADAVAAFNRLVKQDGVKFVIIMGSSSTMALKQSVEDEKIIALTSAATSKAVDANSRYMFRLYSTTMDYMPAFSAWAKGQFKERRIVILNPNDETGWDHNRFSEKHYKQAGFNATTETFERSTKDFQPLITKIIGMKAEIMELGSTPPATAGLIVRQAREMGYKGLFLKSAGPGPKELVAAAGKEAIEGTYNLLYADPSNPQFKRLADEYRKTVGHDANEMIVTYYDAANVLLRAIQQAGDARDTAKVAAAFARVLPTPSVLGDEITLGGKATLGADQQFMTTDYIAVIRNGQSETVGRVK